mmetsp:Transcript_24300/g.36007  ORF Transcript_24300/g.36007 Transcript_24300/m.36007 type:complete len:96 (+) Transcript_24300:395-682(+)
MIRSPIKYARIARRVCLTSGPICSYVIPDSQMNKEFCTATKMSAICRPKKPAVCCLTFSYAMHTKIMRNWEHNKTQIGNIILLKFQNHAESSPLF